MDRNMDRTSRTYSGCDTNLSVVALAIVNTILGACAGGLTVLFFNRLLFLSLFLFFSLFSPAYTQNVTISLTHTLFLSFSLPWFLY